jgi:hypothetical protein
MTSNKHRNPKTLVRYFMKGAYQWRGYTLTRRPFAALSFAFRKSTPPWESSLTDYRNRTHCQLPRVWSNSFKSAVGVRLCENEIPCAGFAAPGSLANRNTKSATRVLRRSASWQQKTISVF